METVIYYGIEYEIQIDNTTNSYMHKLEFALENKTHQILCDSKVRTDYLILARRPDLVKIKDNEKRDKYVDLDIGF